MRRSDLQLGMQVEIVDFGGYDSDRPSHWSPDMDEWQGSVVTIADYDSEYVYIEEDDGAWSWHWYDFEPHCRLSFNNPNIVYKRHRIDKMMHKMREELNAKKSKKVFVKS